MSVSEDTDKKPKAKRKRRHRHIGPNARAMRSGLAFCPMCDAEKIEDKRRAKVDRES